MRNAADRTKLIGLMRALHRAECALRVLDTEISIRERVAAWKQLGGSAEATEQLRIEAVMYQRVPPDTAPGAIGALDLTDAGLQRVDAAPYAALTVLLLGGNALASLRGCGLESLRRLQVLDVRRNRLTALAEAAALVGALPRLATLGVAGNPWALSGAAKKAGHRHALLQLLPQLAERPCALRVLDDERLAADEIVAAQRASKLASVEQANLRFQVLMLTRVPVGYRPADLTELNLGKAQLSTVDLSACPRLVKLSLAHNSLKSLKTSNLHRLHRLRALDISENALKDLAEFAALLAHLPRLALLLWAGNPIAGTPAALPPSAAPVNPHAKVRGAHAVLPVAGTLTSTQRAARVALLAKLAARKAGFNHAEAAGAAPVVVKTREGVVIDVAAVPLALIDGRRVGVAERAEAMRADKRFKKAHVEAARLDIALRRAGERRASVTVLDLS